MYTYTSSPYLQFSVSPFRKPYKPLRESCNSELESQGKFPVYWPIVCNFHCVCNSYTGSHNDALKEQTNRN